MSAIEAVGIAVGKIFFAFVIFVPLRMLSNYLRRKMPEGRLKKILLFSWK